MHDTAQYSYPRTSPTSKSKRAVSTLSIPPPRRAGRSGSISVAPRLSPIPASPNPPNLTGGYVVSPAGSQSTDDSGDYSFSLFSEHDDDDADSWLGGTTTVDGSEGECECDSVLDLCVSDLVDFINFTEGSTSPAALVESSSHWSIADDELICAFAFDFDFDFDPDPAAEFGSLPADAFSPCSAKLSSIHFEFNDFDATSGDEDECAKDFAPLPSGSPCPFALRKMSPRSGRGDGSGDAGYVTVEALCDGEENLKGIEEERTRLERLVARMALGRI